MALITEIINAVSKSLRVCCGYRHLRLLATYPNPWMQRTVATCSEKLTEILNKKWIQSELINFLHFVQFIIIFSFHFADCCHSLFEQWNTSILCMNFKSNYWNWIRLLFTFSATVNRQTDPAVEGPLKSNNRKMSFITDFHYERVWWFIKAINNNHGDRWDSSKGTEWSVSKARIAAWEFILC